MKNYHDGERLVETEYEEDQLLLMSLKTENVSLAQKEGHSLTAGWVLTWEGSMCVWLKEKLDRQASNSRGEGGRSGWRKGALA